MKRVLKLSLAISCAITTIALCTDQPSNASLSVNEQNEKKQEKEIDDTNQSNEPSVTSSLTEALKNWQESNVIRDSMAFAINALPFVSAALVYWNPQRVIPQDYLERLGKGSIITTLTMAPLAAQNVLSLYENITKKLSLKWFTKKSYQNLFASINKTIAKNSLVRHAITVGICYLIMRGGPRGGSGGNVLLVRETCPILNFIFGIRSYEYAYA